MKRTCGNSLAFESIFAGPRQFHAVSASRRAVCCEIQRDTTDFMRSIQALIYG